MSDVINFPPIKKENEKEKYVDIMCKAAELSQLIRDCNLYHNEIKFHFCSELNMIIDHTKKIVERNEKE